MDLEYWVDYTFVFGVAHKIPAYDHMSWFYYHNCDIWIMVFIFFCLCLFLLKSILQFVCCGLCFKTKVEPVEEKEKKD